MRERFLAVFSAVLIISIFAGFAYFVGTTACEQRSVSFKNHRFGVFSGCMVMHNDKWLPLENIRGFDDN